MECSEFLEQLAEEGHADAEHLQACADCRAEALLWKRMGDIPVDDPGPSLRPRFDSMLEAWQDGRDARRTGSQPVHYFAQIAAAVALVLAALLAYELWNVHRELANTRELVALSLLQHESASDRLQGVSWTTRVGRPNPEVLGALIDTLKHDNSVDVRLAALDALARYDNQPAVREGVAASLDAQQSPMVQIAVVDYLVDHGDRDAVGRLRKFGQAPGLLPVVRQRVEWGINKLSRG
jgi:hypothetical protein